MKIRIARKKDQSSLINLMKLADNREENWAIQRTNSYLENNKKLILIAEEKGELIGYVGIKKFEDNYARRFVNLEDYIWITWIAVLPGIKKSGIGSKLLNASERYSKKFNKFGIVLDCLEKVLPFYFKLGYVVAGKYLDKKNKLRYVLKKEIK